MMKYILEIYQYKTMWWLMDPSPALETGHDKRWSILSSLWPQSLKTILINKQSQFKSLQSIPNRLLYILHGWSQFCPVHNCVL